MVAYMDNSQVATVHPDDELHKKGTRYAMVTSTLQISRLHGYILVARDGESGTFLGSLCLIPPYRRYWLFYFHVIYGVIPMGLPPQFSRLCGSLVKESVMPTATRPCRSTISSCRPHHTSISAVSELPRAHKGEAWVACSCKSHLILPKLQPFVLVFLGMLHHCLSFWNVTIVMLAFTKRMDTRSRKRTLCHPNLTRKTS